MPGRKTKARFASLAFQLSSVVGFLLVVPLPASAQLNTNPPAFLGANSCSSSGCHGGGGEHQNQFLVWSLRDFHSQRPFATLTTARSRQIANALRIDNPVTDPQCTSCHAPLHDVPTALRGEEFRVMEGVSCESCHGPAEHWLRSHTRKDFTRADRVASGLRDLKHLYVRANTCVACHQTISTPLLQAGHPELIFELDGQSASQPRHWREPPDAAGAQAWLVGQAAALREMSWQLSREPAADSRTAAHTNLVARWRGLLWLMQKLEVESQHVGPALTASLADLKRIADEPADQKFNLVQRASDDLARAAAGIKWTSDISDQLLRSLLSSSTDFTQPGISNYDQARRAERLVLALDRLALASRQPPTPAVETQLNRLFELSQSIPDFDPARFATALQQLADSR